MTLVEIKNGLSEFGLSSKEARVYLSLLELGDSKIQDISKETKINRTTVYPIINKLIGKGLVGSYKTRSCHKYAILSIESFYRTLENKKDAIKNIAPDLEALRSKSSLFEPGVKMFSGKEGYKEILLESLKGVGHEVLYIGSAKDLNDIIGEAFVTDKYIPKRLEHNIRFRQLIHKDDFSEKLEERDHKELRQTKFLPEKYKFRSNMIIYSNKVAYFSSDSELISVLILSKDIAEIERSKFEMIWDNGK